MKKISISGIIRSIRASVSNVVTNKINDVTSEEIGSLSGVTGNIAEQLQALEQKKNDLKSAQDTFKGQISDAINQHEHTGTVDATSENSDFVGAIEGITTLGKDTADATATSNDIASGKTSYVDGEKITGTLQEITKGSTYMYDTKASHTGPPNDSTALHIIVSSSQDTIVRSGGGLGVLAQNVISDCKITSNQIMSGEYVLGMLGTGGDDATAISDEIAKGKTAYTGSGKITGSAYTLKSGTASTNTTKFSVAKWANSAGLDDGYTGINVSSNCFLYGGSSIGTTNYKILNSFGFIDDPMKMVKFLVNYYDYRQYGSNHPDIVYVYVRKKGTPVYAPISPAISSTSNPYTINLDAIYTMPTYNGTPTPYGGFTGSGKIYPISSKFGYIGYWTNNPLYLTATDYSVSSSRDIGITTKTYIHVKFTPTSSLVGLVSTCIRTGANTYNAYNTIIAVMFDPTIDV